MPRNGNSMQSCPSNEPAESEAERQARILRSMAVHSDTDSFVGFAVRMDPMGASFPLKLR